MERMQFVSTLAVTALGGMIVVCSPQAGAQTGASGANQPVADASGNIHVPENYRENYQHLGAWAVAAEPGAGSKELHDVYASPGAVAAYKANGGHFQDGAAIVKEVYETTTEPMKTGTVSRAKTLKGWFVIVRDSKNSHAGNKLWADGWGWSWFDAANPYKTTSTDYATDCQGCHIPAKATDWIYTQGYPVLR
jgi:Cytochrome P460